MIREKSFENIYIRLLKELKKQEIVGVRGFETKELINTQFELKDPFDCTLDNSKDYKYWKYIVKEIMVFLSGTLDASEFIKISSFWNKCKDDFGKINSNYGYLVFHKKTPPMVAGDPHSGISQFEWVANNLKNDMFSRQAIINLNSIEHKYKDNNDLVCTIFLQFIIRKNKLDMYGFMRSNDLIFGLRYDIVFFCFIQIMMWISLKNKYKELQLGSYYHYATSLHIYSHHFNLLRKKPQ